MGLFVFDVSVYIIALLFVVGAITDMIDGSLARNTNQITDLGKMIDPLADKFLIFSLFLISFDTIPHWVIYSIIGMELVNILSSFTYCFLLKKVTQANFPGKVKMFLEVMGIVFVLFAQMSGDVRWSALSKNTFMFALLFLVLSIIENTFWFLRKSGQSVVSEDIEIVHLHSNTR